LSSIQKSWPDRSLVNARPFGARQFAFLVARVDGRAHGDELEQIAAPLVLAHVEADADDAVRAEGLGLLLHSRHRELARV
jgi:hypothetical protein